VYAANKTGSISDDWIYYQLVKQTLTITLIQWLYSAVSHLHSSQSTAAHALGFSVHTSRLPATDLEAQL
jgi:hypothetical protein